MPLDLVPETPEQAAARLGLPASPRLAAPPITPEELATARPAPTCIVERLLYADVGVLVAPGGVGKTTLMVHVAMRIPLALPVFGETVNHPGPMLIVTAEDNREILVARLRACMDAAGLSDGDRHIVMEQVRIADVSGGGCKLTEVIGDVVLPSPALHALIELAREIRPVLIVIDPAVSFGAGEARVNDAEQGLVEAARAMRNALQCAVLYVHHSGKQNAREKTLDQYSGRGGSAFADGARMVHVLHPMTPEEWREATGEELDDGETGLILARPKISYCPPPGPLYILRRGYHFERVEPMATSQAAKDEARANQLLQFLREELKQGRKYSRNSLPHAELNMTRDGCRAAVNWLDARGLVEGRKRDDAGQRGARTYLHPATLSRTDREPTETAQDNAPLGSPSENAFLASRPYRDGEPPRSEAAVSSPLFPRLAGEAPRTDREAANRDANNTLEAEL